MGKYFRMATESDDFLTWATDQSRTVEELFGIELLVEKCMSHWNHKHGVQVPINHEQIRLTQKNRQLNPRYKPNLTRDQLEHAAEVLDMITSFSTNHSSDRYLRDISFLRFCANLTALHFYHGEINDWSVLALLPQITTLHISDEVARDLRPIGTLAHLENLTLSIRTPWPRLSGLENLTCLKDFHFYGNILALTAIPTLPAVRNAKIHYGGGFNVPLRSVADLPAMPELRRLDLESTDLLDGIERFPHLLNLEIYGFLPDLSPLAANVALTHLYLSGVQYTDLAPLITLRNLCLITLRNDFPPDLAPLTELPRLHEIIVKSEAIVPPDLATLNALCAPWEDEFCCHPPREQPPLRLIVVGKRRKDYDEKADFGGIPRDYGEDREMRISESKWFIRQLNRRVTRILGKGWGALKENYAAAYLCGQLMLNISRQRDLDHLPAVVRTLRQLISTCLYPWYLNFHIDILAEYERDIDEIEDDDNDNEEETFNVEREREEWEYRQQRQLERREYLRRRYQSRLCEELGIEPEQQPAAAQPPQKAEAESEDTSPTYDLGTALKLFFTLTEKAVVIGEKDRSLAEMLLEMKAEDE